MLQWLWLDNFIRDFKRNLASQISQRRYLNFMLYINYVEYEYQKYKCKTGNV